MLRNNADARLFSSVIRAWATSDITVRGVHFILNCEYLERASLNSLYIPLSALPVVK